MEVSLRRRQHSMSEKSHHQGCYQQSLDLLAEPRISSRCIMGSVVGTVDCVIMRVEKRLRVVMRGERIERTDYHAWMHSEEQQDNLQSRTTPT